MRAISLLIFLVLAGPALAQQQQDPLLTKTLEIIATQRNQALGDAAVWQARTIQLAEELAKAQARIKELEPKKPE